MKEEGGGGDDLEEEYINFTIFLLLVCYYVFYLNLNYFNAPLGNINLFRVIKSHKISPFKTNLSRWTLKLGETWRWHPLSIIEDENVSGTILCERAGGTLAQQKLEKLRFKLAELIHIFLVIMRRVTADPDPFVPTLQGRSLYFARTGEVS